jgi:hypothetical protein
MLSSLREMSRIAAKYCEEFMGHGRATAWAPHSHKFESCRYILLSVGTIKTLLIHLLLKNQKLFGSVV